ncbi:putative Holliday junction resolvase [Microbacteriaceae bacterium SG_E_30_P1]|uniref:Putative pre-16S rRNA nuclease n=1 Tax=Antiquaquibacter oligotrophicus TaxID=2880260 RepID=A0ABT6KPB6_9MICO|nr:Holliday junction resolvase RuvX [Antiquaquibacter oligotrophicus]MDH6180992.1 putative Holliday junction resolvase [Antiquaquibacter oligotrophicus]UDF13308.1 Holliday junction resolvase RuvX [Antiquaquibacter oligotrophicus]
MRSGVRLGVDVGTARIGVARSDLHGMLATPVETVPRGAGDVERIAAIVAETECMEMIVGLPIALSGNETASTADAREFAGRLADLGVATVRVVDERLSTVSAHAALRSSGRREKGSRSVVDQVAAVIILQHALDSERASGRPPGALIDPHEGA